MRRLLDKVAYILEPVLCDVQMKPAQVEWKLNHPNGADEDLVNHLKDMFKQYL